MGHCFVTDVTYMEIRVNIPSNLMDHAPIRQKVTLDNHALTVQENLSSKFNI